MKSSPYTNTGQNSVGDQLICQITNMEKMRITPTQLEFSPINFAYLKPTTEKKISSNQLFRSHVKKISQFFKYLGSLLIKTFENGVML